MREDLWSVSLMKLVCMATHLVAFRSLARLGSPADRADHPLFPLRDGSVGLSWPLVALHGCQLAPHPSVAIFLRFSNCPNFLFNPTLSFSSLSIVCWQSDTT